MKLKHYLAFLSLLSFCCISAQNNQKGYLIDRNNKKTEVLFKEVDFSDNTKIRYKTSEDGDYKNIDYSIVEYSIGDDYKFVRKNVKHDKMFTEIATSKEPAFINEELFLNVIGDGGDINLYSYSDKGRTKFFYEVKGSNEVVQFIYKRYSENNSSQKENNYFRNQLNTILKCEALQVSDFLNLKYKKEDFLKIFEKYNQCKKQDAQVYENKSGKKPKIKYSALVGLYQSGFAVEFSGGESEKETKTTIGFGGEVALIFPSEKTEIFLRAEYESYSGRSKYSNHLTGTARQENNFLLESSFINLNVGGRYNFILNNKNKIFIEGAVGINMPFDDIIYTVTHPEASGGAADIELKYRYSAKTNAYFNFGIGYTYNNKISLALRTDTNRNLLTDDTTKFSRMGLNLKYTFN